MKKVVYGHVHYFCKRCGDMYEAKSRDYKPTCSDSCAIERWYESVRAMMSKKGVMYEKWKTRTEAARRYRKHKKGGCNEYRHKDVRPTHRIDRVARQADR